MSQLVAGAAAADILVCMLCVFFSLYIFIFQLNYQYSPPINQLISLFFPSFS